MQDGREITGSLARHGDDMVIKREDGTVVTVKAADVKRVTLTDSTNPAEKSEVEWSRISATIARSDDLPAINKMLKAFLASYPDVPLAKTAMEALNQYSGYQDQGLVKFRTRWLLPASRDAILQQAQTQARLALTLYRSGKVKEATEAATEALHTDDQNSLALSIAGLTSARAGQWVKAKEYFGKIADIDPNNILAHNNLAIISFIQHRDAEGLIHYKTALDSGADNRLVLDNIIEALAAYRGSKDVPAYTSLVRSFTQAETKMAAVMAQQGLFRYGSTWVTQDQKDRLLASATAIQQNMADLDANYRHATAALQSLDQQARRTAALYDATLNDINSLDSSILAEQSKGLLDVSLISQRDVLLQNLNDINRRILQIDGQRSATQSAIKQMRSDAEVLKSQLAVAEANIYSGVQRIMEVGDAESPPPPAAVNVPAQAMPTAVAVPPAAPVAAPVQTPRPFQPSAPVATPLPPPAPAAPSASPPATLWPSINPQSVKPG
jgi:Flp pilus assembly protein TadD